MANRHTGNVQPQLDLEEHYGTLDAKRVVLINKDDGEPYNADLSAEVDDVSLASITSGANWVGLASVSGGVDIVTLRSVPTISVQMLPYSYYAQQSLNSGYLYHGFAPAGSNPTTANFRIMRETLDTGEVLFGGSATGFVHTWSSVSLSSISYL